MKKIFKLIMGILLLNVNIIANTQGECTDTLMEYTDELNQLTQSRDKERLKILDKKVKKLVNLCNDSDVNDDFDQDGFYVYGLKHLAEYTDKLIKDMNTVLPVNNYSEAESAKLISFDLKSKKAIFEIMNYVENHKVNITLNNQSQILNLSTYVGRNAKIAYDTTHNILSQVAFDAIVVGLPECTNPKLIDKVLQKIQNRIKQVIPIMIRQKSYDASGHRILSDSQIEKLKQKRYRQLTEMELVDIQSDGIDEIAKMHFCRGEFRKQGSQIDNLFYFYLKQKEAGSTDIKIYFEGDEAKMKLYRDNERSKEECKNNNQEGCYKLAESYLHGLAVPQSYKKALELYQVPCKKGIANACTQIGFISELNRDTFTAVDYYAKGCSLGDNEFGCASLGMYYSKGIAVRQDYNKALELLGKGCDAKNAEACKEYSIINSKINLK